VLGHGLFHADINMSLGVKSSFSMPAIRHQLNRVIMGLLTLCELVTFPSWCYYLFLALPFGLPLAL